MKIAIIGYGTVGKALHKLIYPRNQIGILDEWREVMEGEQFITLRHKYDIQQFNPDIIFICVPTPTIDGEHKVDDVLSYVEELKDFPGLLVVKSTVTVDVVERILSIRPTTTFWPEFLREDNADQDMKWPTIIPIGAPSTLQFDYLEKFIRVETEIMTERGIDRKHTLIRHVGPKESSYIKYAVNTFLATKVVFFHQFYSWMKARGDEAMYPDITRILAEEPRLGNSHFAAPGKHGLGYAGSCLPKDVEALIQSQAGMGPYGEDMLSLLVSVHTENKEMREDK